MIMENGGLGEPKSGLTKNNEMKNTLILAQFINDTISLTSK
jgi:hypothetical protein